MSDRHRFRYPQRFVPPQPGDPGYERYQANRPFTPTFENPDDPMLMEGWSPMEPVPGPTRDALKREIQRKHALIAEIQAAIDDGPAEIEALEQDIARLEGQIEALPEDEE